MKKLSYIALLLIMMALSGISQEIEYLRIGISGEFWPFNGHMVDEPYSHANGGFEFGTGVSVFNTHLLEAGFTTGFSVFNSQYYGDPEAFDIPKVTQTKESYFYFKGQLQFYPSNLIKKTGYMKMVDPYLVVEYGPEVSYFKKTVSIDYPTYHIDTLHVLRSPSMNLGLGIGSRILVNPNSPGAPVTINVSLMYMFSGPTNHAIVNDDLGYFKLQEGRKEYLFFSVGVTIYDFLQ
jgi:hypothetical protein